MLKFTFVHISKDDVTFLLPGVWSSPELRGERPPSCQGFTLTMVDQHRAVLFGGFQPGCGRVNDVYLFDFRTMVSWN